LQVFKLLREDVFGGLAMGIQYRFGKILGYPVARIGRFSHPEVTVF
jgi:hypothetical protein